MKDQAVAIARAEHTASSRLNVLREFLQMLVLRSLHESEAFLGMAFVGGTALRFLHRIQRYSEDLDFSVENALSYTPHRWVKKLESDLKSAGFKVDLRWNEKSTVNVGWVRFEELLKQVGLSALSAQKLSIKIEVDTRPPEGALLETSIVKRFEMMAVVRHYDRASLFAGKLHAILTRKYTKGRDLYDLMWYLADREWPPPNLELLNNALRQTGWTGELMRPDTWRNAVLARLASVNWKRARDDVSPFLERAYDVRLLEYEYFRSLLEKR